MIKVISVANRARTALPEGGIRKIHGPSEEQTRVQMAIEVHNTERPR